MSTASDRDGQGGHAGLLGASIAGERRAPARRAGRKLRCEDCFFHQHMLCALEEKQPCPTFRPAHPDGLRPPQQLSFVFRQPRRPDPFLFEAPA